MSSWKKSGDYKSLIDIITIKNGLTIKDVLDPKPISPDAIENLTAAAGCILAAIDCETPIYIVGDYDADGITSTAILTRTFTALGGRVKTIIPRRFSDGYGISRNIIEGIYNSLIVTVDNGIAADDVIQIAIKDQGNTVIVIDHHLPQDKVPEADIVIDPHVNPEKNGFTGFCGAGLAYKLAQHIDAITGEDVALPMDDLTVLACLGTIADVMPMVSDNRRLIKEGLRIINDEVRFEGLSAGIRHVMMLASKPFTEESIKFQIGPILNASGRLYDRGSASVLKALLNEDEKTAALFAVKMKEINENRKMLVGNWLEKLEPQCKKHSDDSVIVLYYLGIPEGIVGILTGKIAEQYKRPAFVFTTAKGDTALCKGSGRSYGGFDMSPMVNTVLPLCTAGGGHAGAAGLTIDKDKWEELKDTMLQYMQSNGMQPDTSLYYDMEITIEDVADINHDQKLFAPYGEGIEKPVFLLRNFQLTPNQYGNTYQLMGGKSEHIKFFGSDMSAVAFGLD